MTSSLRNLVVRVGDVGRGVLHLRRRPYRRRSYHVVAFGWMSMLPHFRSDAAMRRVTVRRIDRRSHQRHQRSDRSLRVLDHRVRGGRHSVDPKIDRAEDQHRQPKKNSCYCRLIPIGPIVQLLPPLDDSSPYC